MVSGNKRRRPAGTLRQPLLYYNKSNAPKTAEKIIQWGRIWLAVKIFIPIAAVYYFLFLSSFFAVKDIIITGNILVKSDDIINYIPKDQNIFFIKSAKIERNILQNFPDINQIQIYRGIPNALKIVVLEYIPSAIWENATNSYLISQTGQVVGIADMQVSGNQQLPKILDLNNVQIEPKQKVVSANFVGFVQYINQNIKAETDFDPERFEVEETTVDTTLISKQGIKFKFDTLRSATKQLEDLKTILSQKKPEIKEYVDLRINGWAYYK